MESILILLSDPAAWAALVSLTVMEVVLGIDNLLFISVLSNKLPEAQRAAARRIGIAAALILRLVLLAAIAWLIRLTEPVFEVLDNGFSWRDIILIAGGLFLVWKATSEIHHNVDPEPGPDSLNPKVAATSVLSVIVQILVLDAIFSIDSIITAVGMTEHVPIMVIAMIVLARFPQTRLLAILMSKEGELDS